MIDFRQIRAARALLNWSQADLARAAQMATSSIKNIESDSATARKETLATIEDAFDRNGVEFLHGSGVRLKSDVVTIVQGRSATRALLDSIYHTAHASSAREVCILGRDEGFSVEHDGRQVLSDHVARMKAAGISEKILSCEGDTTFLNEPEAYRWMSRDYFCRTSPVYIYGDKVALHTGSLRRRTIIIDDKAIALLLRRIFAMAWDAARDPTAGSLAHLRRIS